MDGFELIKQGAEAKIYSGFYLGRTAIAKERFVKTYRHPELDSQITKERMKAEARAIVRCKSAGVCTPSIYLVDFTGHVIIMEYFNESITVKSFITELGASGDSASLKCLCNAIGTAIGKMHSQNIVHGDLTTSNMLLLSREKEENAYKLAFIDFGLAQLEANAEDKGVDLYVLERALISTHTDYDLFPDILAAYSVANKKRTKEVLAKFEDVRARGRKRTMVG